MDFWDIMAGAGLLLIAVGAWYVWPPLLLILGLALLGLAFWGALTKGGGRGDPD